MFRRFLKKFAIFPPLDLRINFAQKKKKNGRLPPKIKKIFEKESVKEFKGGYNTAQHFLLHRNFLFCERSRTSFQNLPPQKKTLSHPQELLKWLPCFWGRELRDVNYLWKHDSHSWLMSIKEGFVGSLFFHPNFRFSD